MKRFILFILLFPYAVFAQSLQAFLSTATFSSIEHNYLETYISFDANSLVLIPDKVGDFYANVTIFIEISNEGKQEFQDHYTLKSPAFKYKENNNLFFIDQQRIPLNNGTYTLIVRIQDANNTEDKPTLFTQEINIDYADKQLALSDIQLLESYTTATEQNVLSKSGYDITPFISNFYAPNINQLSFYFEVYNSNNYFSNQRKYILNTYIESYESKVALFDFNKYKRKTADRPIESNLLSFDISQLPTGNYNLVCAIKDITNETIQTKKIFFQRSNTFASHKNTEDLVAVKIAGTFAELINDKELLKQYIDYLYPISTPDENTFAQNQMRYDDIELMQKFFYNFWKSRNASNPELAWNEYHQKVKSVNNDFQNFKIKGYLTDRGRVYLQYGPPNSRHKVDNSSTTYPYEIWHYYKLGTQTNKKFVFVNADFATDEYRLEYSNVYGEVSNAEWRDKIEHDKVPTFGDDFNNNYINPR